MRENIFNGNGTDSGGGGGGSYDDTALKNRISSLEDSQVRQDESISSLEESQVQQANLIAELEDSQWRQDNRISSLEESQTHQDKLIAKNSGNIDRIADKLGIDLAYKYQPLAENEYVVLSGVKSIDTGLKMDGNAEIKATGYIATAGRQGVLAGAYKDNNSRTVFKFLSGSGKAQSCWAGLAEITAENMNGIDLNAPFSFIQNKTDATITQGVKSVTVSNTGYSGSEPDTAIFLFNQTENGEFNSAAIKIVEILIEGKQFRFEPMRKIEIENNTQTVVILKDGKELPLNGGVLEIVEFQAA